MWAKRQRLDHADQAVLITGGSRGIGFAAAQAFLAQGARVAICAKDPARLSAAAQRLGQWGEVEAVRADVRDMGQVEGFVARARERFGRIDVLVNNAGRVSTGDFASQTRQAIDEVIDVNVKGVLYATRAVLPTMLAQGTGVIVNVSSGAGLSGFAGLAVYCTSKFGVVGFTESLAQEVRSHGVRVHGICPGRVATDMQKKYSGQRVGMPPERVAEAILKLTGPSPPARSGRCLVLS